MRETCVRVAVKKNNVEVQVRIRLVYETLLKRTMQRCVRVRLVYGKVLN